MERFWLTQLDRENKRLRSAKEVEYDDLFDLEEEESKTGELNENPEKKAQGLSDK